MPCGSSGKVSFRSGPCLRKKCLRAKNRRLFVEHTVNRREHLFVHLRILLRTPTPQIKSSRRVCPPTSGRGRFPSAMRVIGVRSRPRILPGVQPLGGSSLTTSTGVKLHVLRSGAGAGSHKQEPADAAVARSPDSSMSTNIRRTDEGHGVDRLRRR
jgi:hypothetical protein